MRITDDHDFPAVCRFGPGGDYTSVWPGQTETPDLGPSPLLGVLRSLAELAGLCIGPGVGSLQSVAEFPPAVGHPIQFPKERVIHERAIQSSRPPHDAASTPASRRHRRVKARQLLLPYDHGTGQAPQPQPKYHLRAHSAAPRKRPSFRGAGQSTLFDANQRSARTAG